MSGLPIPLRLVPTLTEVIQPGSLSPTPASFSLPFSAQAHFSVELATSLALSADLEERMVQRVLQRIDLDLEQRLKNVLGQLILEHTQALLPRLRQEIELAVRDSVAEAFEQEAPPASAPL
jgi:hypothetical protein